MSANVNANTNTNLNAGAHHNPLDRNHDGKVDLHDITGHSHTGAHAHTHAAGEHAHHAGEHHHHAAGEHHHAHHSGVQAVGTTSVRAEPIHAEVIQKEVVVHEHIHPIQKEEIQPVIYREREQLDVKQVTQMMHETQIQPTTVIQKELSAEHRAAVVERGAPIQENYVAPSSEIDATLRSQVVHAPIVNEVIKKTVIEEIQPVLERDIVQSTIIQNTQPIYEKFVDAPHVHREVLQVQERGVVGGDLELLRAQGFAVDQIALGGAHATATGAHHNPLDRNHDGRVDMHDLAHAGHAHGAQGVHAHGQAGAHHNPLDRNHDGKVDLKDVTGHPASASANTSVNLH